MNLKSPVMIEFEDSTDSAYNNLIIINKINYDLDLGIALSLSSDVKNILSPKEAQERASKRLKEFIIKYKIKD